MSMSDAYLSRFSKDLENAGNQLYKHFTDAMVGLQVEGGRIIRNQQNADFLKTRMLSYQDALRESGYGDVVDRFISKFDDVAKETVGIVNNKAGLGIDWAKMDKQDITALAKWEHQALMGIGESNFNQIKSAVTMGVLSGSDVSEITKMIRDNIDSKWVRYANTYATTGLRLFSQEVTNISIIESGNNPEDFDYEYVGPLDNFTREQCVEGLAKGIFTYDEMRAFEDEDMRWNCRHEFIPVPKAETEEKEPEAESKESADTGDYIDNILNQPLDDQLNYIDSIIDTTDFSRIAEKYGLRSYDGTVDNMTAILDLPGGVKKYSSNDLLYTNRELVKSLCKLHNENPKLIKNLDCKIFNSTGRSDLANAFYNPEIDLLKIHIKNKEYVELLTSYDYDIDKTLGVAFKSGKITDNIMESLIKHELGHRFDMYDIENNIKKAVSFSDKLVGEYNKMVSGKSELWVSEYASKNQYEFYAECFRDFMLGHTDRLPENMIKHFNEVLRGY